MMRRSCREGRNEIRKDLEWGKDKEEKGKILEGRESVTLNILHRNTLQNLILIYI